MATSGNIVIADESALHLYLHIDGLQQINAHVAQINPLLNCASTSEELLSFNPQHPLYGGEPISILVCDPVSRRTNSRVRSRCCSYDFPRRSFVKIAGGPYVVAPELAFVRAGCFMSEAELIALGTNLCARYYVNLKTGKTIERSAFLTTPDKLRRYVAKVSSMRGSAKAERALKWVLANSASPAETQMTLILTLPYRLGGFGLPLKEMNFDVKAGRLSRIAEQSDFSIDLANHDMRIGCEYDGHDYHLDASADKRRRNALAALDWTIFPIDKHVLGSALATEQLALELASRMKVRVRRPDGWNDKYRALRYDLGLRA